ncbi:MAG: hypothetical protein M1305_04385 [Candidatus Marsarchaeota archaeon]|nr:hypothetical protein [Candidatus Marsarchaeota archaeon]
MKRRPFFMTSGILALSLALLSAGGCAGGAAPAATTDSAVATAPAVTATTVGVATSPTYGSYLTTPGGLPLYTYSGDSPGASTVTGDLLAAWPPFTASGNLTLPSGVGGTLSQITRPDGSKQVAYNGLPLYTFVNDTPGHVTGQGVAGFDLAGAG